MADPALNSERDSLPRKRSSSLTTHHAQKEVLKIEELQTFLVSHNIEVSLYDVVTLCVRSTQADADLVKLCRELQVEKNRKYR